MSGRGVEFIQDPCPGALWECTNGKISGYGDTKQVALASFSEAFMIGRSQDKPKVDALGNRRYW